MLRQHFINYLKSEPAINNTNNWQQFIDYKGNYYLSNFYGICLK